MTTILLYGCRNTFGTPPMTALGEDRRFDAAVRWPGVLRAALGQAVAERMRKMLGRT